MRPFLHLLCLLVGLAGATSAHAQPTRDVVGVAADDVLNVRAGPSASAPVVRALSPLATGLTVVGAAEGWSQVTVDGVQGWVASRFLGDAEIFASPSAGAWECRGTEPFWSALIGGGQVAFESPDGKRRSALAALTPSANSRTAWSFSFDDGASRAIMEGGAVCSDGMSDTVYRRTMHISRAGTLVSGCCRRPN